MNRKVKFATTGNSEVLKLEEEAIPEPGDGEVVVVMKAIGLNRADVLFYQGFYLVAPQFPSSLGLEGAGTIHTVGKDISAFEPGDRVSILPSFDLKKYGVLGDYALVPADSLMKLPEKLSMKDGASIWMSYLTAYAGLIIKGGLKRKEAPFVLISAATSSVGISAIQIAKRYKATVIATTRTSEKKSFLLENGADYVIATKEENFVEVVMEVTHNQGFDIAFDAIAGSFINNLTDAAALEAFIVIYGALSMEETPYPLSIGLAKGLNISSLHVNVNLLQHPAKLEEAKNDILGGFKEGLYTQVIHKTFSFENFREAFECLENGDSQGKVVIENFREP